MIEWLSDWAHWPLILAATGLLLRERHVAQAERVRQKTEIKKNAKWKAKQDHRHDLLKSLMERRLDLLHQELDSHKKKDCAILEDIRNDISKNGQKIDTLGTSLNDLSRTVVRICTIIEKREGGRRK